MESSNNGRRIITISLTEENYQSVKQCADIMGVNLSWVIDRTISNKIPGEGHVTWAEFVVMDALITASLNFNKEDLTQLLDNLICVIEKMKNLDDPTCCKKDYLSRMKDYFGISNS